MNSTSPPTSDELLDMMQGEPREVLREHRDLLMEMREETDNDVLARYIDNLLDEFNTEDGETS